MKCGQNQRKAADKTAALRWFLHQNLEKRVDKLLLICYYIVVQTNAPVAQLVEHMTFNHGVRSSILRGSTKKPAKLSAGIFVRCGDRKCDGYATKYQNLILARPYYTTGARVIPHVRQFVKRFCKEKTARLFSRAAFPWSCVCGHAVGSHSNRKALFNCICQNFIVKQ